MTDEKKTFYKKLLVLVLPIVLQNLIDSAVSTADTVMLNYVSQDALSASSLANQWRFILNTFFYGICSGSSILIAQYWGKKDLNTIERTIGISMRIGLAVSTAFALSALVIPNGIMRLFTNEESIIAQGAQYLQIVAVSYVFNGFVQVYVSAMRATERVMFGTIINMIALFINVILNACFIFGLFGMPKLGLNGVALATTIAYLIAFIICLTDNAVKRHKVGFRLKYLFAKNKLLIQDFLRYTLPALGNDIVWGVGFTMYSAILGHLGSDAVAANSYANVARSLSTVVCFALANGAAIIMGKTMGENKLKQSQLFGKRFAKLSVASGVVAGLCILLASPLIVPNVNLTEEAKSLLRVMLYISCFTVIGQSVNTMLICGIFRAGGDAKFGFLLDCSIMWGYGVLLGSIAAFVFHLPTEIVYLILFMDEIVKIPFAFRHYFKKRWIKNITRDMSKNS